MTNLLDCNSGNFAEYDIIFMRTVFPNISDHIGFQFTRDNTVYVSGVA